MTQEESDLSYALALRRPRPARAARHDCRRALARAIVPEHALSAGRVSAGADLLRPVDHAALDRFQHGCRPRRHSTLAGDALHLAGAGRIRATTDELVAG